MALAPLTVAAFQFAATGRPEENAASILRGLHEAAARGADLLLTQETALTGYAGVDLPDPAAIDRDELARATEYLRARVRELGLALALGTTHFGEGVPHNALELIGADGRTLAVYAKRAMYGEDEKHYAPGAEAGEPVALGDWRVGLRVCFDFRFPEYFRELFRQQAALVLCAFSMVGEDDAKRSIALAHLRSRAAENGFWIAAANSTSRVQNCPTCIVDPDGAVVAEAPPDREALITAAVQPPPPDALRERIVAVARRLGRGE